jgi:hypothetical protein
MAGKRIESSIYNTAIIIGASLISSPVLNRFRPSPLAFP